MNHNILDAVWWTPPRNNILLDAVVGKLLGTAQVLCIGAVAVGMGYDGHWKCYIGYGLGDDEKQDAQRIATNGVPLGSREAACAFFPSLPVEKFEY